MITQETSNLTVMTRQPGNPAKSRLMSSLGPGCMEPPGGEKRWNVIFGKTFAADL